jgi:hypothetical protein
MTAGYVEFEFDLPEALLDRLVKVFDSLSSAPLTATDVTAVPNEQGVYQLFHDGADGTRRLVYIGKTDAEAGLRVRLGRHAQKIQHRLMLNPADVTFKAVRVFVFTAVDLETQLIDHYGGTPWNGSGFGSNDPGRERDTTTYKTEHFDFQFPIDLTRSLGFPLPSNATAAEVLNALKSKVPYLIRFQRPPGKPRNAHPDLEGTKVTISGTSLSAEAVIAEVIKQLPTGWHATKLPSHVIIYKDDKRSFPSGKLIANSP